MGLILLKDRNMIKHKSNWYKPSWYETISDFKKRCGLITDKDVFNCFSSDNCGRTIEV